MAKQERIKELEKALYPDVDMGKLKRDKEGTFSTTIIDDELDPIDCTFNHDNGVHINTEQYTYLSLSRKNLVQLLKMIDHTEKVYSSEPIGKFDE